MSSSMLSINLLCIYILSGTVRAANSGDRIIHQVLAYKWSRSVTGSGRFFFKALTGKIVVINTSVLLWAYGHGRWSLTRGGHAWRLECMD